MRDGGETFKALVLSYASTIIVARVLSYGCPKTRTSSAK